jgi:hypothetical protein
LKQQEEQMELLDSHVLLDLEKVLSVRVLLAELYLQVIDRQYLLGGLIEAFDLCL